MSKDVDEILDEMEAAREVVLSGRVGSIVRYRGRLWTVKSQKGQWLTLDDYYGFGGGCTAPALEVEDLG